jgi:hypothetical protein
MIHSNSEKGEIYKRKELYCREVTVVLNTISVIPMNRKKNVLYEDWIKGAKQPIKTSSIFADRIPFLQK